MRGINPIAAKSVTRFNLDMKAPDGATTSHWSKETPVPSHGPPPPKIATEVVVIGAGIAGLTTAYLLAGEGRRVVVVDEGQIGSGQTSRTSAHLASGLDDGFARVEKLLGVESTRVSHASHAAAIDKIEQISALEKIECDFARVEAFLMLGEDDKPKTLDDELAAGHRAGFAGMARVEEVPSVGIEPALKYPNQGIFEPLKYLVGLAAAAERRGVQIFAGKRVVDTKGADPKKNVKCTITFEDDAIWQADHVVVATNTPAPINDWLGIYLKQASYRTYMIGLAVKSPGTVANALFWDTNEPYHYARLAKDHTTGGQVLLVGGEDHKVGQPGATPERFDRLEEWARWKFKGLGDVTVKWSGECQEPADGVAFIGRAPTAGENVYVITGDSGMGLTHGTLGAMLITDLIAGRPNDWEKTYDPTRKETNLQFVKDVASAAAQYKDFFVPSEVSSLDQIPIGGGAVIREGVSRVAVHRDETGTYHKCSAVCTHLGCVVHWNDVEKSWDCPCHGSRFNAEGRVVMGPAITDLTKVE